LLRIRAKPLPQRLCGFLLRNGFLSLLLCADALHLLLNSNHNFQTPNSTMGFIETKDIQNGEAVRIHYCDWGSGKPVILIHGWPSTSQMWEYQLAELAKAGLRVIAYDRRGFGRSSVPFQAYGYDALAADLNEVIEQLGLNDVTLVGFSMGGGEVVRYLSRYGGGRISRIVLMSAVTPYLAKANDNPDGVPTEVFDGITAGLMNDRPGFLDTFGKVFFGVSLLSHPVSDAFLQHFRTLSTLSSAHATLECAASFAYTDFRQDLAAVTMPCLIIHGDADKTVPIEASGARTAEAIPHAQYLVYGGAPHGLWYTHKEQLNADLLAFINNDTVAAADDTVTIDRGNFPGL
jgi:non-heme chloroperoxidase